MSQLVYNIDTPIAAFVKLSHNVPIATLPTGTWSAATPTQILADLNFLATSIFTLTKPLAFSKRMEA